MCGIAGIIRWEGVSPRDVSWAEAAALQLSHRGPDHQSWHVTGDGRAALAHARLSIIDLSEQANQPMTSPDGARSLVFNGEIYNFANIREELAAKGYTFRTRSDTEVLLLALEEWGPEACSRLEGMFAFALYDEGDGSLLLGRDRAGQKPLYRVRLPNGAIAFASELRTLLMLDRPWQLSRTAVTQYLRYGYTWEQQSLVDGVLRVAPSTTEIWRGDASEVRTYWCPPMAMQTNRSAAELLDELEQRLQRAVERTLVSDVPVAVLLSGGVDSSLVAAMASRATPGIRTFTVAFPGYSVDESSAAAEVARSLRLPHRQILGSGLGSETFIRFIEGQDEPIADPSILPMSLLCEAVSQHVSVALGGDGGDELFGGYVHYQHLAKLESRTWHWTESIRRPAAVAALRATPRTMRGRYYLEMASRPSTLVQPPLGGLFQPFQIGRLLNTDAADCDVASRRVARGSTVESTMLMDFTHYLPNDILMKVDHAAMSHSLEVRSPLLDSDLVEWAISSVPLEQKLNPTGSKILLKALRSRILGVSDALGRKQGFSPPLTNLLQDSGTRDFVVGILRRAPAQMWNRTEVIRWEKAIQGGKSVSHQVFALAALIAWQERYGLLDMADVDPNQTVGFGGNDGR